MQSDDRVIDEVKRVDIERLIGQYQQMYWLSINRVHVHGRVGRLANSRQKLVITKYG